MSREFIDLTNDDEEEEKGPLKRLIDWDDKLGTVNVVRVKVEPVDPQEGTKIQRREAEEQKREEETKIQRREAEEQKREEETKIQRREAEEQKREEETKIQQREAEEQIREVDPREQAAEYHGTIDPREAAEERHGMIEPEEEQGVSEESHSELDFDALEEKARVRTPPITAEFQVTYSTTPITTTNQIAYSTAPITTTNQVAYSTTPITTEYQVTYSTTPITTTDQIAYSATQNPSNQYSSEQVTLDLDSFPTDDPFDMEKRRYGDSRFQLDDLVAEQNRHGESRFGSGDLVHPQNREIQVNEDMLLNPDLPIEEKSPVGEEPRDDLPVEEKSSQTYGETTMFRFNRCDYEAVKCDERSSVSSVVYKLKGETKGLILVKDLRVNKVSPNNAMDLVEYMRHKGNDLIGLIPSDVKIRKVKSNMHVFYPSAHHAVHGTEWTVEQVKRLASLQLNIRKRTLTVEGRNRSGGNALCPVHIPENVAYCDDGGDFFYLDIFSMCKKATKYLYGRFSNVNDWDEKKEWTGSEQARKYFGLGGSALPSLHDIEVTIDEKLSSRKTAKGDIAALISLLNTLKADLGWDTNTGNRIEVLMNKVQKAAI